MIRVAKCEHRWRLVMYDGDHAARPHGSKGGTR